MLKKFDQHLIKNFPFLKTNSFYIAVSGGIDSMVLVNLFQHYQLSFGLLHCNFKLRGEESDADMRFIHDYANENKLQLKIGFFETKEIAKEMKVSIQVAARELRYNWFEEQMIENNVPYVATAHHLDDNLETFIINLSRGTGLDGLTGIPVINDKIFRPLLPFSRAEIEQYAKENNIKWREDSSNESDNYLRNKIRHHVIPALKEISPNFLESFQKTQKYLYQAQSIVADGEYIFYKEVATENEKGTIQFDLRKLLQIPNYEAYLYCWFKDFGFTAWDDIYKLVHAQSGKQVFSEKYQILKNRDYLLLSTRDFNKEPVEYLIEESQKEVKFPLNITISEVNSITDVATNCIFVDRKKLQFPLKLRKWEEGDYFYPYGMKGKKMLSKFFKDEKMSLIDKAQQWVLCSENLIVWVCNKRFDKRFKVTPNTTTILKITIL
ncbi:MAG: tRNA lysidine(34) synthetase TilS [Flavobacterium sp.]|nr:tRNA lysidine(34) synthetase TilS [Flavobacterium sp.]